VREGKTRGRQGKIKRRELAKGKKNLTQKKKSGEAGGAKTVGSWWGVLHRGRGCNGRVGGGGGGAGTGEKSCEETQKPKSDREGIAKETGRTPDEPTEKSVGNHKKMEKKKNRRKAQKGGNQEMSQENSLYPIPSPEPVSHSQGAS